MKLSFESHLAFHPILQNPGPMPGDGGMLMPELKLHYAEIEETDSIPFPGTATRASRWQPRAPWPLVSHLPAGHEATDALDDVTRHLDTLNQLLTIDDDDRPRAA
jgi:hypothetical protein